MNEMRINDKEIVRDEKAKFAQYRRNQSLDSLGEYRLRKKRTVKDMDF